MDVNSGRLMALAKNLRGEAELPAGFDEVPSELERLATLKIVRAMQDSGPDPVGVVSHVNLRSQHPLAQWAKKKRLEKIAAKSRRRNRK
jgi:hypothetical protein